MHKICWAYRSLPMDNIKWILPCSTSLWAIERNLSNLTDAVWIQPIHSTNFSNFCRQSKWLKTSCHDLKVMNFSTSCPLTIFCKNKHQMSCYNKKSEPYLRQSIHNHHDGIFAILGVKCYSEIYASTLKSSHRNREFYIYMFF